VSGSQQAKPPNGRGSPAGGDGDNLGETSWWVSGPIAGIEIDAAPVRVNGAPVRGFALVPHAAVAHFSGARAILCTGVSYAGVTDQVWLTNPTTARSELLDNVDHEERISAVACDSRGRVALLVTDWRVAHDARRRKRDRDSHLVIGGGGGGGAIRLLTVAPGPIFRDDADNDGGGHVAYPVVVAAEHELPAPKRLLCRPRRVDGAQRVASLTDVPRLLPSHWELPCAMAFGQRNSPLGADDRLYVLDCSPYEGGRALLFRSSAIATDVCTDKLARCTWTAVADFTAAFARAQMAPIVDGMFLALDEFGCRAYVANGTHVHVALLADDSCENGTGGGYDIGAADARLAGSDAGLAVGELLAGDRKRRGTTDGSGKTARFSRISGCAIRTRPLDLALDVAPKVAAIRAATAAMQLSAEGSLAPASPQPWPPGIADLVEEYARLVALPAASLIVTDRDSRCVREIHLAY
jgi:hypothetical protein